MVKKMYGVSKGELTLAEELKVFNSEKEAVENYIENAREGEDFKNLHIYEVKFKATVEIQHKIKIVKTK